MFLQHHRWRGGGSGAAAAPALLTLAALAALLLALPHHAAAQKYSSIESVPGVFERDGRWVIVHEDVSWQVFQPEEHKDTVFFYNVETGAAQWDDPRGEAVAAAGQELPVLEPPKPVSSLTMFMVAMVPTLGFVGAIVGRIVYLQLYYPDLLWPTKERKDRKKGGNSKFKPQKARGRLNQDGKGGRSAN